MKRSLIWIALVATACNSSPTPPAPDVGAPRVGAGATPTAPVPMPASAARGNAPSARRPTPAGLSMVPAGARYSIFCDSFSGPDHFTESNALRDVLVRNSQLHDWYVVHQEGQSTLYEGYYKEFNPAAPNLDKATALDAQRARRDKLLVEAIPNPTAPDRKLFPHALFVPLDSPDADAPPEWSLTNAPGYWSVQIAAFTGFDRKQNAIEAVREARAMNPPVQAYYYNGTPNDTISIVCVGSWPAEAIKRQQQSVGSTDSDDPSQRVYVNTGSPLTREQVKQMTGDANVKLLQATVDILDPTLKQTLKDYPEHAVDGAVQMVPSQGPDGRPMLVPRPSMIVPIPHNQPAAVAGSPMDDASPALLNPNGGDVDGLGARLKGLGR